MLPVTGELTAAMINSELGRSPTQSFSINNAAVRSLAGRPSGTIAYSDLRGKSAALLRTTITIGFHYTQASTHTSHMQWSYSGEGRGYVRNPDGPSYSRPQMEGGSIGNNNVAGRTIIRVSTSLSPGSRFSWFMLRYHRTGTWWNGITVGNTRARRSGNGQTGTGRWGNRTGWGTGDGGLLGVGTDMLGGRRSGTHALIID